MQQRYLQLSMNELYAQFFEEHPKIAIGKTKFQSLNPQHVLYSLQTPRNLCLCTINENMRLLYESANGHSKKVNVQIPVYNRDMLDELVCQPPSCDCCFNQCNICKNGQFFIQNYPLLEIMHGDTDNEQDFDGDSRSNSDENDKDFSSKVRHKIAQSEKANIW